MPHIEDITERMLDDDNLREIVKEFVEGQFEGKDDRLYACLESVRECVTRELSRPEPEMEREGKV